MGKEQVQKEQREKELDACADLFGIIAHRKENRMDYLKCRRREPKRAVVIWILGEIRNSLVGAEFGGGARGSSCLGKSSTTDLPLSDQMTLPGIKASCLWKRIRWSS